MALSTALLAVSALCELLLPTMMSRILDRGVYQTARADAAGELLRACAGMLGVAALSLGAVLLGYYIVYQVVSGFTRSLRAAIFRKVHEMSFEQIGTIGVSKLVTRTTHDVGNLNWIASMLCGSFLIIPLMFLGGLVMCLRKDLTLTLIILLAVPLVFTVVLLLSRKITGLWEISESYCDRQNDLVRERLRGIRVIRAFGREDAAHARICDATRSMADHMIRANVTMEIVAPLATFVLNVAAVLIVLTGGLRIERGAGLTPGDVFAVVQYVAIILSAMVSASFAVVMLPHAKVAARRISEIMEVKTEALPEAGDLVLSGRIDLEHVSFCYPGSKEPALEDVSMHVAPGDRICIIGGTGAGKSTLVRLLLGFYAPSEGTVRFDGVDAEELSAADIRNNLSCVLQKSMLYAGTLRDNVAMGDPGADAEAIRSAVEDAQLADFADAQAEGLDYKVEQAGSNLSGGQKQRVAIARALLKQAPIYVFDDSFSALDFLTEARLRACLSRRLEGRTQIVITQRVVSAMHSDCIYVLSDGRLVDAGRHETLLKRCRLYREIYDSQTGGDRR